MSFFLQYQLSLCFGFPLESIWISLYPSGDMTIKQIPEPLSQCASSFCNVKRDGNGKPVEKARWSVECEFLVKLEEIQILIGMVVWDSARSPEAYKNSGQSLCYDTFRCLKSNIYQSWPSFPGLRNCPSWSCRHTRPGRCFSAIMQEFWRNS